MKKREIGNLFLHLTVGCALALLVCWNIWCVVLATFVYAFLREQAQHRIQIDRFIDGHGTVRWSVEKRTFFDFGWLGKQQIGEVLQWTAGAVLGVGAWELREVVASFAVQW